MTHRCLVRYYDGANVHEARATIEYDGPPDWKFEPLDASARAEWKEQTADRMRVFTEHHNQNGGHKGPPSKGTDGLPRPRAA